MDAAVRRNHSNLENIEDKQKPAFRPRVKFNLKPQLICWIKTGPTQMKKRWRVSERERNSWQNYIKNNNLFKKKNIKLKKKKLQKNMLTVQQFWLLRAVCQEDSRLQCAHLTFWNIRGTVSGQDLSSRVFPGAYELFHSRDAALRSLSPVELHFWSIVVLLSLNGC